MEYTLNIHRIRPYAYIYVHIRAYICTNAHTYLLTYTYIYLHWLHCWGRATASAASVSEVVLSYLEYTLNIHCIYIEYTLNPRFPFIARTGSDDLATCFLSPASGQESLPLCLSVLPFFLFPVSPPFFPPPFSTGSPPFYLLPCVQRG